ncbi:hypothetical protein SCALM49S_04584 [Streptomyces californicus]
MAGRAVLNGARGGGLVVDGRCGGRWRLAAGQVAAGARVVVQAKGRLQVNWSPNGTDSSGRCRRHWSSSRASGPRLASPWKLDNGSGSQCDHLVQGADPGGPVDSARVADRAVRHHDICVLDALDRRYPDHVVDRDARPGARRGDPGRHRRARGGQGRLGDSTGWRDVAHGPPGRVWALEGDAKITTQEPIGVGEIASWPSRWAPSGQDAWVPVEGTGTAADAAGPEGAQLDCRRRIPRWGAGGVLADGGGRQRDPGVQPGPSVRASRRAGAGLGVGRHAAGLVPVADYHGGGRRPRRRPCPRTPRTSWQLEFVYSRAVEPRS